jgi:TetR/AcrR family transcriptional regulator, ethionamide resistance regulator
MLMYVDDRSNVSGMAAEPSIRPARRRSPRKGDLKEQAILDTAVRLLSERSFDEIGIDELARGAGISRPTFYFYFESKQAVLRILVEQITEEVFAASDWLSGSEHPPEDAIRSGIERGAKLWRDHGSVLRAAVDTWGTVPELRRFWEQITARFVDASAEQIKLERRSGNAPEGPPSAKAMATALIRMSERCFYTASLGAEPSLADRELVTTLTTIFLRAIYGTDSPSASSR